MILEKIMGEIAAYKQDLALDFLVFLSLRSLIWAIVGLPRKAGIS